MIISSIQFRIYKSFKQTLFRVNTNNCIFYRKNVSTGIQMNVFICLVVLETQEILFPNPTISVPATSIQKKGKERI